MRLLSGLVIIPVFFLPTHRKEAAAVRVSVSDTADQRFVISIHGMRVLNSNESFLARDMIAGHLVRQRDTIAAPTVLDLGGWGSIDLAPVDTKASVTTRLMSLWHSVQDTSTVTGARVRIAHPPSGGQFTAVLVDKP